MTDSLQTHRSSSAASGIAASGGDADPRLVLIAVGDRRRRDRIAAALTGADLLIVSTDLSDAELAAIQAALPDLVVSDDVREDGTIGDGLRALLRVAPAPLIAIAESEAAGVACFEEGAADYVVNPFTERELRARALARMRRQQITELGELKIDRSARRASVRGEAVELSRQEFDLLVTFVDYPRAVLSREQLLEVAWRSAPGWQGLDTVTEHVYRLRRKIERDPSDPKMIVTVRGRGYRFDPQTQPDQGHDG
jgi:DNA-binding response OmpR family regulator